ncbi:LysR substrate-binding domain-containing protein [Streptomyces mesophilus]|uniref:LysR substrate-binding domain-containing protein n=1 Tax=Streptomyces mesophilus TaxID=1775132 RepID=UPI0033214C9E
MRLGRPVSRCRTPGRPGGCLRRPPDGQHQPTHRGVAEGLVRSAADHWFRSLGIHPHIAAEADGHETLLTLVALGYGTGIVPHLVLHHSGVPD